MKDKTIAYVAIGAAAFLLLTRGQAQNRPPAPPPPMPPQQGGGQQWAMWVSTIASAAGNLAQLFAPGGPFNPNQAGLSPQQAQEMENMRQFWLNTGTLPY